MTVAVPHPMSLADAHGAAAPEGLHTDTFTLPAVGRSAAAARHRIRDQLTQWGIPESVIDDVLTVVSEFVTNVIMHSHSEKITCVVWSDLVRVHVEVLEDSAAAAGPCLREPSVDARDGRGLMIVQGLAQQWGVIKTGDDHSSHGVWATLAPAAA